MSSNTFVLRARRLGFAPVLTWVLACGGCGGNSKPPNIDAVDAATGDDGSTGATDAGGADANGTHDAADAVVSDATGTSDATSASDATGDGGAADATVSDASDTDAALGDSSTDGATTSSPSDAGGDDAIITTPPTSDSGPMDAPGPGGCPATYTAATTTPVVYPSTGAGDLLGAITWDERTMVWVNAGSSTATIHYSDRANRDAAFTTDDVLDASLGPFAYDKVGLSADGLTLIFVNAARTSITSVTRPARGATFSASTASTTAFHRIVTAPGISIGDLVLSKNGDELFLADRSATKGGSILHSQLLSDGTWDDPVALPALFFEVDRAKLRRPTGISADALSLFFFDDRFEQADLAQRTAGTTTYPSFTALAPNGLSAMPTDACDRVYMSVPAPALGADAGATPLTIVHAP
jgi:hypothetical protein